MIDIHYEEIPASVQVDLCDLAYRKAAEYFKDPSVQARYEKWRAERELKVCHQQKTALKCRSTRLNTILLKERQML